MIKTHPISALALAASVAMALSGCGGSGGGSDSNSMPISEPPTGGDWRRAHGPAHLLLRVQQAVRILQERLAATQSPGNSFTFMVRDDGTGCVGSICSGKSISINNFSARKNANGQWEITSLPGSGSGGSGGGGGGSASIPPQNDLDVEDRVGDAIAEAASAIPNAGSVTQSSNVDSNGVTIDQVEVTVEYGASQNRFSVTNGADWSIDTDEGYEKTIAGGAGGAGGRHPQRRRLFGYRSAYRRIDTRRNRAFGQYCGRHSIERFLGYPQCKRRTWNFGRCVGKVSL